MVENKYICPQCGTEMIETYEKPALNLICPKCGCKIATTRWEAIDLDDTYYELVLDKIESPTLDVIKIISKMTGDNYLTTKSNLMIGNITFKCLALEIKDKKMILDDNNIKYNISPDYPY